MSASRAAGIMAFAFLLVFPVASAGIANDEEYGRARQNNSQGRLGYSPHFALEFVRKDCVMRQIVCRLNYCLPDNLRGDAAERP